MTLPIVERLRSGASEVLAEGQVWPLATCAREAADTIEELVEALRDCRWALAPFAECAQSYDRRQPDSRHVGERIPCISIISLGELRRAAKRMSETDAILTKIGGEA